MVDWVAALGGVSTAIQIAKDLRAVDKSVDEAVHKAQLVTLMEQLSDLKLQMIDAREEAKAKDDEIRRLGHFEIDLQDKVYVRGFYLDKFDDGSPRGEPYCPYCIERKAGLFRLHGIEKPGRPDGCPNCKTEYRDAPSYIWEEA